MVGRAAKIRFGPVGTGYDLSRLVWPCTSEEHAFSSQTADLSELLPNRPQIWEVGPPGCLPSVLVFVLLLEFLGPKC
jgi:hypothetical protein